MVGRHAADRRRRVVQHGGLRPQRRVGRRAGCLHRRRRAREGHQDRRLHRRVRLRGTLWHLPARAGQPAPLRPPVLPEGASARRTIHATTRTSMPGWPRQGSATGACSWFRNAATPTRPRPASPIPSAPRSRPGSSPRKPILPGASQVVMERNPYFWAVDTEGNQLPYVDRVIGRIYADTRGAAARRHRRQHRLRLPRSRQPGQPSGPGRESRGGRRTSSSRSTPTGGTHLMVYPNLTHQDPELRELYEPARLPRRPVPRP